MQQRMLLKSVATLLLVFSALSGNARGQEYVGVLPEMLKPEVAEKIGLSDEQRAEIDRLIKSRISAAIGLSQQLREAPLNQHDKLREDFGRESEALAYELLDESQKAKLAKYRVEWLGLLALDEPEVADALNLADWQKELVAEQKSVVRSSRRSENAEKMRASAEGTIRQNISDSQWAAWQLMAGLITESNLGDPAPPVREQPAAPEMVAEVEQASAQSDLPVEEMPLDKIKLAMNFQGQPWSEVIQWLASQADLSVQSETIPPGSFTYRDRSRTYSVTEALDIMNAALLDSGYTLFRQGRMLRCIDFEQDQEMAGEVVAELADYVDEAGLADRGKYEPIKYLFTLERLDPETIKTEVENLLSVQGSVISLPTSGQLVVTDMAGHVRTIADYLRRAEDPNSARGSSIQTFPLKAINAEEVLSVARPLLGLAAEANTSDDLSISTNTFGTTIYAKGSPDKIQNLRDLIQEMDKPPEDDESMVKEYENPYIDRHRVVGFDIQLAYNVISQLLAGSPDVRLATDETAKQLVLFARSDEHELVKTTLATLAGETSDFQVIQLERLDPQLAIAAINKFFGITDIAEAGQPVIDGDLLARQVWVKGSAGQVEQIREFVDNLEANAKSNDILGDRIRMIPLTGRSAAEALKQVERLWQQSSGKTNSLRFISPGQAATGGGLQQRTFAPQNNKPQPNNLDAESGTASADEASSSEAADTEDKSTSLESQIQKSRGGFLVASRTQEAVIQTEQTGDERGNSGSGGTQSSRGGDSKPDRNPNAGADIVIMEGPGGLIISSEDTEALAQFESLLRLVSDQAAMGSSEPTVVYLRNIKASAAKELLESILSGSASSGGGDGLLGDMASSMLGGLGGGLFGAMMGGGGGGDLLGGSTVGMASGDYSIVADPRLNALVIKASPSDMVLIEQLLEVIDQIESPFMIETKGQLELIPVVTQDVSQVLATIKSLYGDRIEGASSGGGGGGGGGGQPNPAEIIQALRGGGRSGRGGGGGSTELAEAKISLGADTNTNMLIVMGQPSQIQEIKKLVALIDQAGESSEEQVVVAPLGAITPGVLQEGLSRILGANVQTNTSSNSSGSSSTPSSNSGGQSGGGSDAAESAARAQRAAEFFQRMRAGGGFGGGGTTGGGRGDNTGGGGRGGATGGSPFGGRGGATGGGRGGR